MAAGATITAGDGEPCATTPPSVLIVQRFGRLDYLPRPPPIDSMGLVSTMPITHIHISQPYLVHSMPEAQLTTAAGSHVIIALTGRLFCPMWISHVLTRPLPIALSFHLVLPAHCPCGSCQNCNPSIVRRRNTSRQHSPANIRGYCNVVSFIAQVVPEVMLTMRESVLGMDPCCQHTV